MTTKEKIIFIAILLASVSVSLTVVFGLVNLLIKFISRCI
jgi:hypothetical protein